jgi:2-oxoglutarate/2-oxoacid ferredoxin oxidoreductase subunit alpha
MTDKEMFLSMSTVEVGSYEHPSVGDRARAEMLPQGTPGLRPEESHLPYRFDPIDAPPAFSPIGGPNITRFTGSSHDEHGMLTKDSAKIGRLNEHLHRKIEDHTDEIVMVNTDLQEDSRTLLISYGITARAMREAANAARNAGQAVSTVTVQSLWPIPEDAITGALCGPSCQSTIERVLVAELNLGDFRREVERVIYRWAARTRRIAPEIIGINRVDGELITPGQFLEWITSNEE